MEQQIDVWSLIVNNEFEKACEKADEEYEKNPSDTLNLRNKVYALLHLKRYADVISLCEKLIAYRRGETDADFLALGIANWILENTDKAINAWQQAQNSLYKDAAGGIEIQVFLYFAGVRIGEDKLKITAIKAIKKLLKSKKAINFPGPLGHYLVDNISENEMLSFISKVSIIRERELSQADFVSAIKRLELGDTVGYYKKLKECIDYGSRSYLSQMYYLAKGELELMR